LFIGGREIANGFSELNDAEDQAERFKKQVLEKDAGDDEAMHYDSDYICH
jgi:lysyl-tRNA synthetase class 2